MPASPGQHPGQDVSGQHHRCLQVQPRGGSNNSGVDYSGHVGGLHPGVVHQHVDRPVVSLHDRDQGLDSASVGQVDDYSVPTHLGRHGAKLVGCSGGHHHVGTRRRVGLGQRGPDPLRSTGHQYPCPNQFHAGDRSPTTEPASRPVGTTGTVDRRPGSGA